jgi:hypothetical protein
MTMRITVLIISLAAFVSCQGPAGERAVTGEAAAPVTGIENYETYFADIETSNVEWIGARPASQHDGLVGLKEGQLMVSDGEIAGGRFVIDLENIVVLDITDPARNARLKAHLESDDFFDVPNHPEAVFEITGIEKIEDPEGENTHRITGNLQMRGVTRSVTFDAAVDVNGDRVSARSEQFLIDRTEWGVNYQSPTVYANLVDRFILDDLALVINLAATRQ